MEVEIFVPHCEVERQNCEALAEYLSAIYYG